MDIDYHLPSAREDSLKAEMAPKFAVEIAASVHPTQTIVSTPAPSRSVELVDGNRENDFNHTNHLPDI
jgi:hypothetical protein